MIRFVVVALVALGVLGATLVPARVSADKDAEKMAERYVEAANTGNIDLLDAIVAEDVTSSGQESGLDALKARLTDGRSPSAPYSEWQYKVIKVVAEGDTIAAHLQFTATMRTNGEEITTEVMSFWHLNDAGKIAEMITVVDIEPILKAMGQ
jgi:Predicted ester cyclase